MLSCIFWNLVVLKWLTCYWKLSKTYFSVTKGKAKVKGLGYTKGYFLIFIDSIRLTLSSTVPHSGNTHNQKCRHCFRCDDCKIWWRVYIKEKETSNVVLDKVTKKWTKAAVNFDNDVAERSRRIGSSHSY